MTIFFIGSYYELTAGVATKYYYAGSQRIAMRKNGTLYYMFSDHLGSTSITTDASGNVISELRYKPWGETRYAGGNTSTKYQYTGQFSYESQFGLYFYQSRFYDPSIGRFSQPDSIIPEQSQGVQAWDRFAYTNNNPVRYNDPSGHCIDPVCLAIIGGTIGFLGSVILQTGQDIFSNQEVSIDWKQAVVYGVAGAVAGATYGAINPAMTMTVAGVAFASGAGGLFGGQAGALADATWDAASDAINSNEPVTLEGVNNGIEEWWQDSRDAGFLDPVKMLIDTGSAALLGGVAFGFNSALTQPLGGTYVTAAARAEHTILPQVAIPIFSAVSDYTQEIINQMIDPYYDEQVAQ